VALLSTHVPDLETWHHHLGHCSTDAIVDMAWKGVVKGMCVDLSTVPPVTTAFLANRHILWCLKCGRGIRVALEIER